VTPGSDTKGVYEEIGRVGMDSLIVLVLYLAGIAGLVAVAHH
jgi:hypothetical protein